VKKRLRIVVPLVLIAALAVSFWYATGRRATAPADRIAGNGTIETTEVDVTSQVPGKVAALPVREGDSVRSGALIATLDRAALDVQVQQAREALRAAEAQLSELRAGTRPEDIDRARAQYRAALDAQRQAKAHLDLVRAGARPEEVARLRAGVRQAEVGLENAERELGRAQSLQTQGAVSQQQADLARTQRDTVAAQLTAARQALLEAEHGARPEEIRAAEAAFAQANSQASAAKAALDLALAGPRRETIEAAAAEADRARAALQAAEVQRDYARIAAPMDGTVTLRNLEPGDYVIPGTPIVRLAALDRVWLRVYVSETQLGRVKLGQRADITVDTYPGKTYRGRVIEIAQQAEFTPKTVQTKQEREKLVFGVKVEVGNPEHDLKPGMPADAVIMVGAARSQR
jgi:HlyD family secretion protein